MVAYGGPGQCEPVPARRQQQPGAGADRRGAGETTPPGRAAPIISAWRRCLADVRASRWCAGRCRRCTDRARSAAWSTSSPNRHRHRAWFADLWRPGCPRRCWPRRNCGAAPENSTGVLRLRRGAKRGFDATPRRETAVYTGERDGFRTQVGAFGVGYTPVVGTRLFAELRGAAASVYGYDDHGLPQGIRRPERDRPRQRPFRPRRHQQRAARAMRGAPRSRRRAISTTDAT